MDCHVLTIMSGIEVRADGNLLVQLASCQSNSAHT